MGGGMGFDEIGSEFKDDVDTYVVSIQTKKLYY